MNRRDLLKALASISLLGLLVGLPKVEESCIDRMAAPAEICLFVDPELGDGDNSGLAPPLSLAMLQEAMAVLEKDETFTEEWIIMWPGVM